MAARGRREDGVSHDRVELSQGAVDAGVVGHGDGASHVHNATVMRHLSPGPGLPRYEPHMRSLNMLWVA